MCVKEDQAGGLEPCKVLAVSVNRYINETSKNLAIDAEGDEREREENPKKGNKDGVGGMGGWII